MLFSFPSESNSNALNNGISISNTIKSGKLVVKCSQKAEGGIVEVPRALARGTFTNPP